MTNRVDEDYDIPLGTLFKCKAKGHEYVFVGYHYTVMGLSACFIRALTGTEPVGPSYPWNYRVSFSHTFEDKFYGTEEYKR